MPHSGHCRTCLSGSQTELSRLSSEAKSGNDARYTAKQQRLQRLQLAGCQHKSAGLYSGLKSVLSMTSLTT